MPSRIPDAAGQLVLFSHLRDSPFGLNPAAVSHGVGSERCPIDLEEDAEVVELVCNPVPFLLRIGGQMIG